MNTKKLESEKFKSAIPGFYYSFIIEKSDQNEVGIYFNEKCEDFVIKNVKINLSIDCANINVDLNDDHDNDYFDEFEYRAVFPINNFIGPKNKFFVKDILKISFSGTLVTALSEDLYSRRMGKMLWEDVHKDFALIVEKKKIMVHKLIFRQFSPIFYRIFDSKMKESIENQVEIPDFDFKTVEAIVKLCYDHEFNEIHKTKNDQSLVDLLRFVDKYDMKIVKNQLEVHLCECITDTNVSEILNAALKYKVEKLRGFCVNFIINSMTDPKPFDGAQDFNPEVFSEVFKYSICQTSTS
uniref:BTB domain-containing protein n=1 Tax=Panagrolaimus sp. ES5 TaxID=591445 RepID=A0AC34FH56_9BILA